VKSTARSLILLAAVAAPAVVPADLSAQHRAVPRPPVHGGYARPYYQSYYRPYYPYYRPYYYGPSFGLSVGFGWYGSFGWYGAYGYPYYGYGYGYPYAYPFAYPYPYPAYFDYGGSARIQIQPRQAEVFIDGHLVGTVDDFDGWAQRLNVAPGEHELTVFLKGYQTYRENVLFRPGATLRVEHVMQPLAAGQPEDARPVPSRTPRSRSSSDAYPPPDLQRQPDVRVPSPRRGAESGEYGSLSMRVQPLDAEVIVDGEPWQSPEAGSLTLQLADGLHRVTVRKEGYRVYNAEVRVRRGDTTSVNVSLSRE